tara:strand:- start:853 stop:1035 length:183 start_codon:yes stop_codon:yes gene_type:complete
VVDLVTEISWSGGKLFVTYRAVVIGSLVAEENGAKFQPLMDLQSEKRNPILRFAAHRLHL